MRFAKLQTNSASTSPASKRSRKKTPDEPRLRFTTDNATCLSALQGDCHVAGGTAWFWARPDAFQAVDVLFVDEAAQMSLANVLAVSQAAKSLVLLGDPQQLDQPTQGSHPEGTDTSALDHILAGQPNDPRGPWTLPGGDLASPPVNMCLHIGIVL